MCRPFGFRATHPTKVECGLVQAQNSLVRQSRRDARGLDNPDGWGLGRVRDGEIRRERQVEPAHRSEGFRRDAADAEATTVLAHVRRATVGEPRHANTHPFRQDVERGPDGYRAVVLASERITDEDWSEVPEGSVFHVDEEMRLRVAPLRG